MVNSNSVPPNVTRSQDPMLFFSGKERKLIANAIREAELKTSGEIRVHLERLARENIFEHAKEIFEKLGMARTRERNGVLFFIGVRSQRFAVLGDRGIHEKLPHGFWGELTEEMTRCFNEDRFADGLVFAIQKTAEVLQKNFPYHREDLNELPDEISYSL